MGARRLVTDATISQGEALHEVAEVTVIHRVPRGQSTAGWSTDALGLIPEGTAMAFAYGPADSPSTFYGYVSAVSVKSANQTRVDAFEVQVPVVYTLLGPTAPMQQQVNRIWPTATASYIARTLARAAGLRPQVQRSARVFQGLPQQAASDFAFLRSLADEVGYRLVAHGSTLWLTDPLVSLREPGEETPTFVYSKAGRDNVKSFQSTAGETDPSGSIRARREGYSYNRSTGALIRQVAQSTKDARLVQYSTGRPFASQQEAQDVLNAEALRDALWVNATMTVVGEPRLRPGTDLLLSGEALGPDDPGAWMVRQATHRVSVAPGRPSAGAYWTDVVLGRDRVGGLALKSRTGLLEDLPQGTLLIDGRWRAQSLGEA
ncbi:contractile injection system protein, VgrG/Pvc8 family [Streptomyces sp. NPDC004528]|uniref:contractile injection system protein, VgrG/Pvc8 family n=1 Tax=Streptomyces sp. NPDC004528 TaxID=3154550 RepID=UPI0033B63D5A